MQRVARVCQRQLSHLLNYKINNWLQFLFFVKATATKQQISKFCPQIQRTEAIAITFISVSSLSSM